MKLLKDYLICFLAYVSAYFVVHILWQFNFDFPLLIYILFLDIVATFVIYVISSIIQNASLYDPYWSVAPLVILIFYLINSRKIFKLNWIDISLVLLIVTWSLRLTYNWISSWNGLKHEDWRYKDLRSKSDKHFWFVNLIGIQIMPTILVYLGLLSIYPIFYFPSHNNLIISIIAIIVTSLAILIESLADIQLNRFKNKRKSSELIILSGLWAHCRHPNYFGEILFWWGLYLFNLSLGIAFWWMVIGPISITFLFIFISIPMIEKKNLANKPAYHLYVAEVSKLIPHFKKRI